MTPVFGVPNRGVLKAFKSFDAELDAQPLGRREVLEQGEIKIADAVVAEVRIRRAHIAEGEGRGLTVDARVEVPVESLVGPGLSSFRAPPLLFGRVRGLNSPAVLLAVIVERRAGSGKW